MFEQHFGSIHEDFGLKYDLTHEIKINLSTFSFPVLGHLWNQCWINQHGFHKFYQVNIHVQRCYS